MILDVVFFIFFYYISVYFTFMQTNIINKKLYVYLFIQFTIIYIYILFMGMRPLEFVSDTSRYIDWFNNVKILPSIEMAMNVYTDYSGMARDSFFSAFLYCLSYIFDSSDFVFWLFPLMIIISLIFIGYKHFESKSDILLLTILLLFNRMYLDYSINQFRSSFVFLLIILLLHSLYIKKNYLSFVGIPFLFFLHRKTVVLAAVIYFLSLLNFRFLFILLLCAIFIYINPDLIIVLFNIVITYLLDYKLFILSSHNILENFDENLFSINFYIQTLLFVIMPTIIILLRLKRIDDINKLHVLYLKIILISLALFFSLFNFIPEIYRVYQLIIPLLFILLVLYKNKVIQIYFLFVILINSVTFLKNIIEQDISIVNFLVGV